VELGVAALGLHDHERAIHPADQVADGIIVIRVRVVEQPIEFDPAIRAKAFV